MIHLGDITKIHGGTAPVVDSIIGGSPCQDLSIAAAMAEQCAEKEPLVQILAAQKRQEDWRIIQMPGSIEQEGQPWMKSN